MAEKPKNDLPKVPPFVIPGTSNHPANKPTPQNAQVVRGSRTSTTKNDQQTSQTGMFGPIIVMISILSLGIALVSGAWFAYGVLGPDSKGEENPAGQTAQPQEDVPAQTADSENKDSEDSADSNNVLSKVIVVGLTFAVGWIFSAIGVRSMRDKILPYAVQAYIWVVLGGIIILQILIMVRLYRQEYQFFNYMRYLFMFGAGLIALVGLHLLLEKHSLVPFGFIILLASLGHLYTIVYHYVFVSEVVHSKVWGDISFFFVTTFVSVLMMAHFGFLNGMRRLIHRMFNPKNNQFGYQN
jgi:predicted tellurium resistance membrane protein TerC